MNVHSFFSRRSGSVNGEFGLASDSSSAVRRRLYNPRDVCVRASIWPRLERAGRSRRGDRPVACGSPDTGAIAGGPRDRLIFAAAADATTLDPHNTTDTESDQVIMMVYEPLIAFDDAMAIRPRLAERWSVADDGVTWTFHLRGGVRFHDGTPFDAEAVRLNFVRVLDPVANHKRQSLFSMIDRVEVVDPLTVRFVTKFPFGAFEPTLAHVSSAIVSPAVAAAHGKAFGTTTAAVSGTGPYRLAGWKKDQEVVLRALRRLLGRSGSDPRDCLSPDPRGGRPRARPRERRRGRHLAHPGHRHPAPRAAQRRGRAQAARGRRAAVPLQRRPQALRRPAGAAGGVAGHRPAGDRPQPGVELRPAVDQRADADHARLHQPGRDRLRPGQGAATAAPRPGIPTGSPPGSPRRRATRWAWNWPRPSPPT